MSERNSEPIFCSECQEEVKASNARMLDGKVLCKADLASKPFVARMRARKLAEDDKRWSGKGFQSAFTAIAALMLVVGVALIFKKDQLVPGIWMVVASILTALSGLFVGSVIDILLDIRDQLKGTHNR